jgi:HAD superfamily hydrolase (TIGR01549 family)
MSINTEGVYFDFFGTLIDSRNALTNIWSKIARRLGVEISYEDPRIWEGMQKQNKEYDKINKFFIDLSEADRHRLNSQVLITMGIDPKGTQDIVSDEFEREFSTGSTFHLCPGCRETLKQIYAKGIKVGLLTHATPDLFLPVMKRLEILEFFDIFVHTSEVGYHKNRIEIYEIALDKMKAKHPENIIHVGDDYELDVKMAQKIGFTPILFDPLKQHNYKNIITVSEFSDILKYIQ